ARALPRLRDHVEACLTASEALDRDRVLACGVRLLDRGFFRVGGEEDTTSYGLATMLKQHVRVRGAPMVFDYPAQNRPPRTPGVAAPLAADIACRLKRRRGGGPELLAFKAGRRWQDVRSDDINVFIKEGTGDDFSAKDFRTWSATVLAAVALAVSGRAHG